MSERGLSGGHLIIKLPEVGANEYKLIEAALVASRLSDDNSSVGGTIAAVRSVVGKRQRPGVPLLCERAPGRVRWDSAGALAGRGAHGGSALPQVGVNA